MYNDFLENIANNSNQLKNKLQLEIFKRDQFQMNMPQKLYESLNSIFCPAFITESIIKNGIININIDIKCIVNEIFGNNIYNMYVYIAQNDIFDIFENASNYYKKETPGEVIHYKCIYIQTFINKNIKEFCTNWNKLNYKFPLLKEDNGVLIFEYTTDTYKEIYK